MFMSSNLPAMHRRRFLTLAGGSAVALGVAACGANSSSASGTKISGKTVRWISPRGTLEVLDDYPFWVAKKLGYFGDLNIPIEGGPLDATATVKFVDQNKADMGYPSPGVFSLALAQGLDLVSVFQMGAVNPFDIAVAKGSPIKTVQDLRGKTIALGSAGWQAIVDPILAEGGMDPKQIKYVEAGNSWAQALSEGKVDAALSWEGLRAQWLGQGLTFDYVMGQKFSKFSGNSFVVRRSDFEDQNNKQLLTNYLKGWAMGLEFAQQSPLAATHLTMEQFPALKSQMKPEIAVRSLLELQNSFHGRWNERQKWGAHILDSWSSFLVTLKKIGQLSKTINASDVIKNDLIDAANSFDKAKVASDANGYQVPAEYKAVNLEQIRATVLPS
jgi:NitT/TauT family transport system substrate-binding protein